MQAMTFGAVHSNFCGLARLDVPNGRATVAAPMSVSEWHEVLHDAYNTGAHWPRRQAGTLDLCCRHLACDCTELRWLVFFV